MLFKIDLKKKYSIFPLLLLLYLVACKEPLPLADLSAAKQELSKAKSFKADKYAPEEYQEARQSLLKSHDMATSPGQGNKEVKQSAVYAWNKARDAIEKSIPSIVTELKDNTKDSLESAREAYADKIASTEYNKAINNQKEAETLEEEASKLLRTYPSRESEQQQSIIRSMAFEKYNIVISKYKVANESAKHARNISVSQSPQILDSTTDIDKNLALSEKYIKLREPPDPSLQKKLEDTRNTYESAKNDIKSGMIKSGIEKIERSRKDSEDLLASSIVPYAEKRLALAKTKIDSAEKYSIDKAVVEKDDALQEMYRNLQDTIEKSKEKFNSANGQFTNKEYEPSIDNSNESIKYSEDAMSQLVALDKKTNEVAERLAREAELKRQRELAEKRRKEEEARKNQKPKTQVVWGKYRVKKDNTLWKIAKYHSMYGKATDWKKIYKYNKNKIRNPDLIYPDQIFTVPVKVKVIPPKKDPCNCDDKDKKEKTSPANKKEDEKSKSDDFDEEYDDEEDFEEDDNNSSIELEKSDDDSKDSIEESLPDEKEDSEEMEDNAPSDVNTVDPGGN